MSIQTCPRCGKRVQSTDIGYVRDNYNFVFACTACLDEIQRKGGF